MMGRLSFHKGGGRGPATIPKYSIKAAKMGIGTKIFSPAW